MICKHQFKPIPCPNCGNTHRVSFGELWNVPYAYEQWIENCDVPCISEEPRKYENGRIDLKVHCWCPKCNHEWVMNDAGSVNVVRQMTKGPYPCET